MSFEFFTEPTGTYPREPSANIFQKRIYINTSAQKKFNIKSGKHVLLGFDKEKQQICLKFVDPKEPGCRSIFNGGVSCKYFLDYFQIPRPQNILKIWSEGSSIELDSIIIQLKKAD